MTENTPEFETECEAIVEEYNHQLRTLPGSLPISIETVAEEVRRMKILRWEPPNFIQLVTDLIKSEPLLSSGQLTSK